MMLKLLNSVCFLVLTHILSDCVSPVQTPKIQSKLKTMTQHEIDVLSLSMR